MYGRDSRRRAGGMGPCSPSDVIYYIILCNMIYYLILIYNVWGDTLEEGLAGWVHLMLYYIILYYIILYYIIVYYIFNI